ncbi:hypothetical protein [Paraburkholderia fungorum]|nr:hypothetical protein [Paraburkholderia fungorum]
MDGPYQQVRTRLDRVLQVTKTAVDVPQAGETPTTYEARLTAKLMPHCTSYQPMARLDKLAPDLFRDIQRTVVAEAMEKPAREGTLAPYKYKDQTGRVVTEYAGSMSSWMNEFKINHGWRGPIVIQDEAQPAR